MNAPPRPAFPTRPGWCITRVRFPRGLSPITRLLAGSRAIGSTHACASLHRAGATRHRPAAAATEQRQATV